MRRLKGQEWVDDKNERAMESTNKVLKENLRN